MYSLCKSCLALVATSALWLGGGATAEAAFVFVTNRAALGGTDSVDWGALGPPFTNVTNPFTIASAGGMTLSVSKTQSDSFQRRDEGNGWSGIFSPGDHLLWTNDLNGSPNPISLGQGFQAAGAQVQADAFGPYTARVTAFDAANNVLATFTTTGNNTGGSTGTAPFLGILSTDEPISRLSFNVEGTGNVGSLAINRYDFSPPTPAPEPGSLLLFGTGAVGLLLGHAWRRRAMALPGGGG
jgi:hypothetical protein